MAIHEKFYLYQITNMRTLSAITSDERAMSEHKTRSTVLPVVPLVTL